MGQVHSLPLEMTMAALDARCCRLGGRGWGLGRHTASFYETCCSARTVGRKSDSERSPLLGLVLFLTKRW